MKKRSGFRRQIRYLGGLLRRIDASHIQDALAQKEEKNRQRTAFFHQAEQWRDRLLDEDDTVISEILDQFPGADLQHLRQLARNARRERNDSKPPRAGRELFRTLQRMIETQADSHE